MLKYFLILYKKISVYIKKPCCRYYPSCSDYAIEAIDKYGSLKGLYLSLKRLITCNQLFPGGYDPVK
ncbi:MAG: membrane protein insertion efficiency factor YidD [bacterium]